MWDHPRADDPDTIFRLILLAAVIEAAERFGPPYLRQLLGRIGRRAAVRRPADAAHLFERDAAAWLLAGG